MRFAAVLAATLLVAGCGGGEQEAVWEQAPPLTHGRAAHAVVSDGSTVWSLGGTGASGEPVLEVERLDGGGWRDVATLPGEGLNAPAAAFLDGRIYVIGGFGTTTNVATEAVHVYDVESGRWTEAAPLREARGGHAAAVLDGKIHATRSPFHVLVRTQECPRKAFLIHWTCELHASPHLRARVHSRARGLRR